MSGTGHFLSLRALPPPPPSTFVPLQTEHAATAARREARHGATTIELEGAYEHKLALEMGRFDALAEEIEAVEQRCEGLLSAASAEHARALRVTSANGA